MSAIFNFLLFLLLFLAPIVLVLNSPRCGGKEKNIWLVITLLLSWVGWLLFITTVKKKQLKEESSTADLDNEEED